MPRVFGTRIAIGLVLLFVCFGCTGGDRESENGGREKPSTPAAANGQAEPKPSEEGTSPAADDRNVVKATGTVTSETVQAKPEVKPGTGPSPRIVVPVKSLDFGKQKAERTLSRSFVVRNSGKAPLEIEAVEPS